MKKCFLSLLIATISLYSISQDSISVKESFAIKYMAEQLVKKELSTLLNYIANPDVEVTDRNEVKKNSHSGDFNKIFESPKVIIEDDINPNHRSSARTNDLEVSTYLDNFDLFYTKSSGAAVVFSDIRVSEIKKSDRLYLKVYFNSFFRNANKKNDTAYAVNNRVAELFIRKEKNEWKTYIARIGFFNPKDTVNDVLNDVVLARDPNSSGNTSLDSAEAVAKQKSWEQELRQKADEAERRKSQFTDSLFDAYIQKGDKARQIKDYPTALANYYEAKKLKQYDRLPKARIDAISAAKEEDQKSGAQLYNEYKETARKKILNREYGEALELYNKAIQEQPDKAKELDAEISSLNTKWRNLERLNAFYNNKQYSIAVKEYDGLIKKDKGNSDYFLGRAKCYEQLGESKKALKDYDQAIELDRNNIQALLLRARLHRKNNKDIDAMVDYKDYLKKYKDEVGVFVELADLLVKMNQQQVDEAIKVLDEGLTIPGHQKVPQLYLRKGLFYLDRSDFRRANENFSNVVKIDSNHAYGYYNRGKAQLAMNNLQNAALDFESARRNRLDSQYIRTIENYGENLFQKSTSRFNQGAKDSAIAYANYAIAINPNQSFYRFTRGEYYFSLGNYKEAVRNYDDAVEISKYYPEAYFKRGLAYYRLKNYQEAIDNFGQAAKLDPSHYLALKGLGDAYLAVKDYGNASMSAQQSIKLINALKKGAPDRVVSPEIYNVIAKSTYYLNDLDKSLDALQSAVRKNPSYADAYFNMGLTYHKKAALGDAITNFSKAVAYDKSHPEWYYALGKAYYDKKDYTNAALNLNSSITLDSLKLLQDAIYLRGLSNYRSENYPAAYKDYMLAQELKLNEKIPAFNEELGNIYLHIGKHDSANYYFNKVLEKEPSNSSALYGIATSLALKGNKDEALPWFEKSFQSQKWSRKEDPRKNKEDLLGEFKNDKRFVALRKKYT